MKDKSRPISTDDIEASKVTTEDIRVRMELSTDTRTTSVGAEAPRARVLREAGEAVLVDRATAYGPPEDSFTKIAALWNGYATAQWPEKVIIITPMDVCNMMELLKIARSVSNPAHFDNYTDRAGYAACAADLAPGQS